jgi:hypothetical protein
MATSSLKKYTTDKKTPMKRTKTTLVSDEDIKTKEISDELKKFNKKVQDNNNNLISTVQTQMELKLNAIEIKIKETVDELKNLLTKKIGTDISSYDIEASTKITEHLNNDKKEIEAKINELTNKIHESITQHKKEIISLGEFLEKYKYDTFVKIENLTRLINEKEKSSTGINPADLEQLNITKNLVRGLDETTKNLVNKFNGINSEIINNSNAIKELNERYKLYDPQKIIDYKQIMADMKNQITSIQEKTSKEIEEFKIKMKEIPILPNPEKKKEELNFSADFEKINARLVNMENKIVELEKKKVEIIPIIPTEKNIPLTLSGQCSNNKVIEKKEDNKDMPKIIVNESKVTIEDKKETPAKQEPITANTKLPESVIIEKKTTEERKKKGEVQNEEYQPNLDNPFEDVTEEPLEMVDTPSNNTFPIKQADQLPINESSQLPSLLTQPTNISDTDFSIVKEFEIKLIDMELKIHNLNETLIRQPLKNDTKNLEELESRLSARFNQTIENVKKDFHESLMKMNLRMEIIENRLEKQEIINRTPPPQITNNMPTLPFMMQRHHH